MTTTRPNSESSMACLRAAEMQHTRIIACTVAWLHRTLERNGATSAG